MKNTKLYDVRTINNLKEMLETSTSQFSNKPAFYVKQTGASEYSPISYQQYKADVDALGTALISLGLKGKRIAIIGENRYEWAVSYLAAVNGTGVAVPLDKELPPNEIEILIKRSQADAVIFSGSLSEQFTKLMERPDSVRFFINMDLEQDSGSMLSFRCLLEKGYKFLEEGNRDFINAEIDNSAMCVLLFTSGTTDVSKAVMLSHENIAANLMAMCSMLYIDEKDIFLSVLPLHHTYECTCGFLCQIYRGCAIAYCEGLRHIPKNLQEAKCTIMLGVPLIFESMYRRIWEQAAKKPGLVRKLKIAIGLSNLLKKFKIDITRKLFSQIHESLGGHVRLFISGAAGIDPKVAKGFRDMGIKLVQDYGLTECAPIVALNRDIYFKDDAAGLPLPGLDVEIHNPGADGIGEIRVRGKSVMLGYYEDEKATRDSIIDGWFHTGDLGFIDDDGFVHITGRKKNTIVTKNGKNIYPEEIETLLNRSSYILESMVYGKNDEEGDVIVAAVIVPDYEKINEALKNGTAPADSAQKIISHEIKSINKSLVIYKHIKYFELRDEEFEKTTTRKIKRYAVKNK